MYKPFTYKYVLILRAVMSINVSQFGDKFMGNITTYCMKHIF